MAIETKKDPNHGVVKFGPVPGVYLNLFQAKAVSINGKTSGEPKYSGDFLLTPGSDDYKAISAKAFEVAKERWPGRDLKELQFAWSNGDKLAAKAELKGKKRDFYKGFTVLKARTQYEPQVSVVEGGSIVDYAGEKRALASKHFKGGQLVFVEVKFVAYDGVGNNPDGVTAYLNAVVATGRKGVEVPVGGQTSAEKFSGYIGLLSEEDPTAGSDPTQDEQF